MKFTEPWGVHRLAFLLEKAMSREAKMWKGDLPKKPSSQDTDISPTQRDEAVCWLTEIHSRLQLYPETLVLAVSILDRFLSSIKFHAMVLSCSSGLLDTLMGLKRSQHLALLTRRLYHCLADHKLIKLRGSMLALAILTLELETCCRDWLALTIELLKKAQIDTSELIRSRELVACSLSALRAPLLPNTVYIYQAHRSQDHLGRVATSTQSSSPAGEEGGCQQPCGSLLSSSKHGSLPALLAPPKPFYHLHHLLRLTLRCKSSTKRKVEEMEVDDFYDGIKRLYNEDYTTTLAQEGAPFLRGATTTTTTTTPAAGEREGGRSSPCPPLQPVCAS
ncbi:cyclin-I isoform X2 [Nerophis ophidion]|uniref:cyclin-I isoform X2 n=1 Tax=Nerophis ophidion TaxID=159077 RepID=UPI002AE017BC|nr:cyclin-I isoform X2 [Nerophis ophidion]